jgi:hypothetical protein
MTVFRIKQGSTTLDFGSKQAALQFLDNYPPHIREKVIFKETTAAELETTREELTTKLRQSQRFDNDGVPIETPYTQWLLSRIDMYDKALPVVQAYEAQLKAKEESRIAHSVWEGGPSPVVNEVWRP